MVTLRLGDGVIEVTPERQASGDGSFEEVIEKKTRIGEAVDPEELGKLVKEALDSH